MSSSTKLFLQQLALSIAIYIPSWYAYQMTYHIGEKEVAVEYAEELLEIREPGWHWKQSLGSKIIVYKQELTIKYKDSNNSL